jgi:hypothetical protein
MCRTVQIKDCRECEWENIKKIKKLILYIAVEYKEVQKGF